MRLSRLVAGVRESEKSTNGQPTGRYDLDESGNV
jgi:hypothetical protein